MTRRAAPPIVDWDAASIAERLRHDLAGEAGPGVRQPLAEAGPGRALLEIVAHLAGIVVDRVRGTPEKAFLSFLDLIGTAPLPALPARAPLTFALARGAAGEARVPRGTRVAALATADGKAPPIFEVASDLSLTAAEPILLCQHDPSADTWRNLSAVLVADPRSAPEALPAFSGLPITRRLWIAHPMLAGGEARDRAVAVTVVDPSGAELDGVGWGWWDGAAAAPLDAAGTLPSVPIAAAVAQDGTAGPAGAWLVRDLPRHAAGPPKGRAATLRMTARADDLPPDAVLSGTAPLDATKDFMPFGAKPGLGDACLISCEAAFAPAGPGGTHVIQVSFTASPRADKGVEVTLAWEYWTGDRWGAIGRSGGASATSSPGAEFGLAMPGAAASPPFEPVAEAAATVAFARPPDWARSTVAGIAGHWLRVRVVGGSYGRDAVLRPVTVTEGERQGTPAFRIDPETWKPPAFGSLVCAFRYASAPVAPERALLDLPYGFADLDPASGAPRDAGPALDSTGPALYLAFRRAGGGAAFDGRPVSLFFGFREAGYGDLPSLGGAGDAMLAGEPVVRWDCAGPGGVWSSLAVQDGTANLTRTGIVSFVGPAGSAPLPLFGREATWLRATLAAGRHPAPPRIERFASNTAWAEQSTRIAFEPLGSGTAEPGQSFRVGNAPMLAGQVLEVAEAEQPRGPALDRLVAEEGPDCVTAVRGDRGDVSRVWVRWHEVPNFYASGTDDRHYTLDRTAGLVTFGGDGRGRAAPRGTGNVRISYATGGGSGGNVAAGTITQLKSALPYVASVVNLIPAGGGADAEGRDAMLERGPKRLRHSGRAVTISDFEDLAFEASPAIARVCGVAAGGETDPGVVEIIVVPSGSEARPEPSLGLIRTVQDAVAAAASPTVSLVVRGPDWVTVSVAAEVVAVSVDRAVDVGDAAVSRLQAFLHPITGGVDGAGWTFGRAPHRSDLYAVLQGLPGVDHIASLSTRSEPETSDVRHLALVCSGQHSITVVGPATPPAAGRVSRPPAA